MLFHIKRVFLRFFLERYYDQSAQLGYYLMLSVFPFLLFVFSLISYLPITETNVLLLIKPFAPAESYEMIHDTVDRILSTRRGDVLSISAIFTFWLSSMAVQSLVRSLNEAYNIKRKKSFFLALVYDLLLTIGFMVVISFSLIVPVLEEIIQQSNFTQAHFSDGWSQLWLLLKWGMGSLFMFFLFTFLYLVVPSRVISVIYVIPGALVATFGWQAVSLVYSRYVRWNDYTEVYGQLGSVITLMVWFYLSSAILLLGGLLNGSIIRGKND
ncbi:YihY/virulence factor BrkB family protein [Bacillus seohaeanensis]|jgi:membrane protein|uniref:YihY/virulence factor BrkB family protein n=1 Tax=Bacillus seohaeanensis TaxID=284580 RepID=A0ABW5RM71_9BACI